MSSNCRRCAGNDGTSFSRRGKFKFGYEYYHDDRTADRGNPLLGTGTLANATVPFAPGGGPTTFFGSPTLNRALADVQTGMAFIDHDCENGLTVKSGTLVADVRPYRRSI